jgi:hypothetical protein
MAHLNLGSYTGRVRRPCPKCGVTVEVERPTRMLSRSSARSSRNAFRREVQNQILFEALCDDCRAFWNRVLHTIEHGDGTGS